MTRISLMISVVILLPFWPVIVLAHLVRALVERRDREPQMEHGVIEKLPGICLGSHGSEAVKACDTAPQSA